MIKYRYALSESGVILDIHEFDSSARGRVFTCIACSGRLVPHLKDDLRARHFAHHRHASLCPGRETYLHQAAKALFSQTYRAQLEACEPFQLAIPVRNTCTALRDELGFACGLAPYKGRVYGPCCGSGGMFVQSEKFVEAQGSKLGDIIYGQESNATTRRAADRERLLHRRRAWLLSAQMPTCAREGQSDESCSEVTGKKSS